MACPIQPARFYDAIVSRVQAGVGVAHTFPLLGSLVKRKVTEPHQRERRV